VAGRGIVVKRAVIAAAVVLVAVATVLWVGPAAHGQSARPAKAKAVYTYGSDSLQTVTVYSPKKPNGASVVLIHGGGFRSSAHDASSLASNANSLTAYGDTVFIVNYRNDIDGVGIADQVADVVDGTDWVVDHAAGFGADPSDLTMIGGSSGGLLTGAAAEDLNSTHPGTVKTVITLSGTEDFANALSYWSTYPGPEGKQHMKDLTGTLGCPKSGVGCSPSLESAYSPDRHVSSGTCTDQWIIFNGNDEVQPTSQATDMDDALAVAGCPHTLDIFPDTAHAFDYWSVALSQIQSAIQAS
jgi:acetyl esterase/lipase